MLDPYGLILFCYKLSEWVWSGILTLVLNLEVVEQSLEVVLSGEAGVEQEAFDTGPFTETSIIEHLQVVGDDEGNDTSR